MRVMPGRNDRVGLIRGCAVLLGIACAGGGALATPPGERVEIFREQGIHFAPGDSARFASAEVRPSDGGRLVARTLPLSRPARPTRITAWAATRPVPKAPDEVHDRWDRAGNVRLRLSGGADIEILRFVTAYGGATLQRADVSHLAPLLEGPCTFVGFIDTWTSPAWTMDFGLEYSWFDTTAQWEPALDMAMADWVLPLLYTDGLTAENQPPEGLAAGVEIPAGTRRVVLVACTSGHCTDGRGADEFVTKDHVVAVDGFVVERFRPWRGDCRRFRELNPYCRRWADGSWSSDYSRSGWCPGDRVAPLELDLTDHLGPGPHRLSLRVEDIRPRDEEGHFGYWRVSACLVGWHSR